MRVRAVSGHCGPVALALFRPLGAMVLPIAGLAAPLAAQARPEAEAPEDGAQPIVLDLRIDPPRCPKGADPSGAIVVCAPPDDPLRYLPRSLDAAQDDYAARTMDAGDPRAPDFRPPPCVPSLLSWCFKLDGPSGEKATLDPRNLPEAPPGSDADLIARGERPRG